MKTFIVSYNFDGDNELVLVKINAKTWKEALLKVIYGKMENKGSEKDRQTLLSEIEITLSDDLEESKKQMFDIELPFNIMELDRW